MAWTVKAVGGISVRLCKQVFRLFGLLNQKKTLRFKALTGIFGLWWITVTCKKTTQLNLAVLASLAGGPARPQLPLIRTAAEPGSYQLNWDAIPGAAAYAISFRALGSDRYEPFRFVPATQAGDVIVTGFTAPQGYAVSLAAIDRSGRVGAFSPEVIVAP